jgi:Kef-type K+ transport system membrane component KefB
MALFERVRFRGLLSTFGLYFILLGGAVFGFALVAREGHSRFGDAGAAATGVGPHGSVDLLLHVLLALSVVIIVARAFGALLKLIGQPAVIGEVIGGIVLGPSFLRNFAPEVAESLIPAGTLPSLGIIAQLGVILFMFLVGLEFNPRVLKRSGHAALLISHASIAVPFLLGAWLALKLYDKYAGAVPFVGFAMFIGASFSVTAFPVLARILSDRGLTKTRLGALALTCAAVDDVTAWCLVAIVLGVAQANIDTGLFTVGLTVAYIALMFSVARPIIARLVPYLERVEQLTETGMAIVCVALLLSALATEFIGIHAIFGAFLLGAITPHQSRVAINVTERLDHLVRVMFLPAFFAFTGLRVQLQLLDSPEEWLLCVEILLFACIGKIGGSWVAGRLTGLGWREAGIIGVLMNTRGLVELIVLNLGLDTGILTPPLFTMLVLMALVTTFLTGPLLSLLMPRARLQLPDLPKG